MSYVPPQTPTFERDRIKALKNERISSQKKTFTKWVNSFLDKSGNHVDDLFIDLADGKILIRLLEIISGEKIGIAARGKFRVHNIENVNRALEFLQKSVKLESIGAEDIVDGNERLILGLIWMVILRFQIADISYEDDMSKERKSAKEALLLWCQRMTRGYPGVDIQNFTTSWRNGLAFNALIHRHRPDLIDYKALRPSQHEANLNNAFNVAEERLGITRLLDAEDVDCPRPDDRSVMTYVSAYYQYFAKMKSEETGGRRIAKIIGVMMEIEKMEKAYDVMVSDLLEWIARKVTELARPFQKNIMAVQKEMATFKYFRTVEKPPRYTERVNIEAHLFSLQTKRKANNQRSYSPPEGKLVKDINRAWQGMENAEHTRAQALRNELIRQEMLEKMAEKFERKAGLRESWLDDMMHVLEEEQLGQDAATVEAALKRHEAISTDVKAREERFQMVFNLAQELIDEDYYRSEAIRAREEVIMTKWDKLVGKLEARRSTLMGFRDLVGVFRDMDSAHSDMIDIEAGLRSEDYGRHLLDVQNLLDKHSLVESQIQSQRERIYNINAQAQKFIRANHPEIKVVKERQRLLSQAFEALVQLGKERRARLEDSLKLYTFFEDLEEEEIFIKETEKLAASKEVGRDLTSLTRLQQRHEGLEAEILGRYSHCEGICGKGQSLIDRGHFASKEIKAKIKQLQANWIKLKELATTRKERLKDAAESLQYYSDANDAESWMKEKMSVVCSEDYGRDEQSAMSLLQRHSHIQEEIKAFSDDIDRLKEKSKLMGEASRGSSSQQTLTFETYEEEMEVETDEEVEETIEKEVLQDVVQMVNVPQVRVNYPYSGQGLAVEKGEVLYLIAKTNKDWWSVRRTKTREAGYVPANYVKEVEPRSVKKVTKQKVMVPEIVKMKRIVKKMVTVKRRRPNEQPVSPRPSPRRGRGRRGVQRHFTAHFDRDNVAVRQISLTNMYNRLVDTSQTRSQQLENAIKYYHFCHECDDMDMWIVNQEKQLKSSESQSSRDAIQDIRRKLERLSTELLAKASRMSELNHLADELIHDGHAHSAAVKTRRKEINEGWGRLQRLKDKKEEDLAEKHGVELFYDLCEEMRSWIKEKDSTLFKEDLGKDIESVRAQQRRHQGIERDLAAVEDKVDKLQEQAKSLVVRHPRQARQIKVKEGEITKLWDGLKGKASQRKALLDDAYGQQGFLADSRDLLSWVENMKDSLNSGEEPHDIDSANELIQQHGEKYEEIQTRFQRFDQLDEYGRKLLSTNPNVLQVKESMKALKQERASLSACWAEVNERLHQGLDLQVFIRDAEHMDTITASHETFLSSQDLGSSVDEVERLLKKQEDLEKTLTAQEERVRSLADMANSLAHARHYAKNWIASRTDAVTKRRKGVRDQAANQRKALMTSQVLQNFMRDADEFGAWIHEKSLIATDESYKDSKNLQRNIQRHKAFEAEIAANKDGMDRINKAGKLLIRDKHYGAQDAKGRVKRLNENWLKLQANSAEKGAKLQQAQQQQQFNRALEATRLWMAEVEAILGSENTGHDLSGVKFLLKKHQLLESDIEVHAVEVVGLVQEAGDIVKEGHFNAKAIQQDAEDVRDRYDRIFAQASKRRSILEDALGFHQFLYDVEMERSWIREHLQLASSSDLGTNLVAVQRLQKRHLAFENELTNHQTRIDSVLASGQDLIESCHYATDEVEEQCEELKELWDSMMDAAAQRKKKLAEAYRSQKYFSEANEADTWMNDKAGLAANQDYGKDRASAETLLTRHAALETDVKSFSGTVKALAADARKLVQSGHFDSAKISSTQRDLEEQFSGLKTLVRTRQTRLEESKKLHQYSREVEELSDWINEQLQVAASEDYGTDFEHLQAIQNKFSDFQRSVTTYADNFRDVDNFAKKLVAEGHTDTVTIKEHQDITRSMWVHLEDQIALRKKRLTSAEEIHRFNRDLNELISRIQEKDATLSMDELGRDLASALALQRNHEVFERELSALSQQVDGLTAESARLQATYQGQTAQSIRQHEEYILRLWEELKRKSARKASKLRDAYEFYKLSNAIRDLISWCIEICRLISSDEPVHSISDAERLLRELDEHRIEIEAREDAFTKVLEKGEEMIDGGHFAEEELTEKLELLLNERESLYTAWEERKAELTDAYHQHVFLRDAKQIDALTSTQEVVLAGAELGSSVDEVDFLLKKHENTEKLVWAQHEKVSSLRVFGEQLVSNGHRNAETIRNRLKAVCERRAKLNAELDERKVKLQDSRKIAQFYQDVVEAESWITEKLQTAMDESYKDPINLESKLQKQQAFEAELTAHEEAIDSVRETGEELITSGHFAAAEVEQRVEALYIHWEELLEASATKTRKLLEARDHQKFNQEVDIADSCISEKEAIVSCEDLGRDYEHCVRMQRKMKEFDQDLAVDAARVETINLLAEKLIDQGHAGSALIQQRQQALTERWNRLQDRASERRQRLAEACEIHAFDSNCKDVAHMITIKTVALSSKEFGRDLSGVEALIRKHDDIERELTVIEEKMEALENEAYRLVRSQPHMARTVQGKQSDIIEQWERLNDLFDQRKGGLEANRLLQIFLVDYRDLMSWMGELCSRIAAGELGQSVRDAEAMLELHQERKGEIDARLESFNATVAFGTSLVDQDHVSAEQVRQNVTELGSERAELLHVWQEKLILLQESKQLQVFLSTAEKAENWISKKETLAQTIESRDSLDTVEALLKAHMNFEKSLAMYEDNIKELQVSSDRLISAQHYDAERIKKRCHEIMERWKKLKALAASRSGKLGESKLLFQFLRDCKELETWVNEKLQVAAEASYREATNLQQKLQKHQTFEAEITARKGQLDGLILSGDSLTKSSPGCQDTVESKLKDLSDLWTLLSDLSNNKAQRLKEAIQKQTFERNVTELQAWIDDVENQLASTDYGKDMRSVNNLIKKNESLQIDIANHDERVREILQQANEFVEADHFFKEEIADKAADVAERFEQLAEPATERTTKLEDSLSFHQYLSDAQVEMDWIREKEPQAASEDYGRNLLGVQNLLKKHEALESEMTSHELLVTAVLEQAVQLIGRSEYGKEEVKETSMNLQDMWQRLRQRSKERKQKLKQSLAAQQYYDQVFEVEVWVREKLPLVSGDDFGRDETSAETLLRKHDALQLELDGIEKKIEDLKQQCHELSSSGNIDRERLTQRQEDLENRFSKIRDLSSYRHRRLQDSARLFNFLRECDELEMWIEEREGIVTSDDSGRDLEHVEMLMEKFEVFTRDLVASGERIATLTTHAQQLLDEEHSNSETIEQRAEEICERWEQLKERTGTRLDELDRARDLHTFNRSVEEIRAWIQEKEAALLFTEDGARDLSSVQALQRKHEGFQRDLKALGDKVGLIVEEAGNLADKFPAYKQHLTQQKNEILDAWEKLQQLASSKQSHLRQSEGLQAFLDEFRDLISWISAMSASINAEELGSSYTDVEILIAQNQEFKSEVNAREKTIHEFLDRAEKLIETGNPAARDIKEKCKQLKDAWDELISALEMRFIQLNRNKDVQEFKREADQLEGWLNAREQDLLSEDVGDSLEAVEELLKKHDEFEKMLAAQREKFKGFTKLTPEELRGKACENRGNVAREKNKVDHARSGRDNNIKELSPDSKKITKNSPEYVATDSRKISPNSRSDSTASEQNIQEKSTRPWVDSKRVCLKEQHAANEPVVHKENFREGSSRNLNDSNEELVRPAEIDELESPNSHELPVTSPLQGALEIVCEGVLQRKQELRPGQRSYSGRWESFYAVLASTILFFYHGRKDFKRKGSHAAPPLDLENARFESLGEAFRIRNADGSQFLFTCKDMIDIHRWTNELELFMVEEEEEEEDSDNSVCTSDEEETDEEREEIIEKRNEDQDLQSKEDIPSYPGQDEMLYKERKSPQPPIITVTSFDDDEDNGASDLDYGSETESETSEESDPSSEPPGLPDTEPPEELDDESHDPEGVPEGVHENPSASEDHYPTHSNGYENDFNDMDILSEEDIVPEFYPDAPVDFNDNSIPDIPDIAPPDIPAPAEFDELEEGDVDDDTDLHALPVAPPPPVPVPTDHDIPVRPLRKSRAPPPPVGRNSEARYRSDSQDSLDDILPSIRPPKPPLKPKPVKVPEEKKPKKGVFGIFKKRK